MGVTNNPVSIVGLLVLIHAAYSAAHYKSLVLESGVALANMVLPADVLIELAVGTGVVLLGSVFSSSRLLPVKQSNTLHKTYESLGSPPEFHTFSHRGQALRARYPSLAKSAQQ